MNLLVTGGAGFIGSNFIRYMLATYPDVHITNYDKLTYAGNLDNLADMENHVRYELVVADVVDGAAIDAVLARRQYAAIIHMAAESHVDRSIADPSTFVRTNVLGTQELLAAARRYEIPKFILVSTDEVYGSLGSTGSFSENSPIRPNSPYSASKAGADLLALAYAHTYGTPVCVTRCSNNYGPYQFPEKLIPLMISRALHNEPLPVYGDGLHVRDWIHVEDHCRAIDLVLRAGRPGEVYNVGGHAEHTNLAVVHAILQHLQKPESLIQFVADRQGHDRRYAIDDAKIRRELGWRPVHTWEAGIGATIDWYVTHQTWWERILSGAYRKKLQSARQVYGLGSACTDADN